MYRIDLGDATTLSTIELSTEKTARFETELLCKLIACSRNYLLKWTRKFVNRIRDRNLSESMSVGLFRVSDILGSTSIASRWSVLYSAHIHQASTTEVQLYRNSVHTVAGIPEYTIARSVTVAD